MQNHLFARRTFLRGVGVTMALPWLEFMRVWGDDSAKSSSSEAPIRLRVTFSGNGFHSKEWWAKGEGKNMELGKVLSPDAARRVPGKTDFCERIVSRSGTQGKHS